MGNTQYYNLEIHKDNEYFDSCVALILYNALGKTTSLVSQGAHYPLLNHSVLVK